MTPGAELSRMRPLHTITCAVCGTTRQVRDSRAKYCGNACRQRAKYARSRRQQQPGSDGH